MLRLETIPSETVIGALSDAQLRLSERDVHLWAIEVSSDGIDSRVMDVLSEAELARVASAAKRDSELVLATARAVLRYLLGAYLRMPPSAIRLIQSSEGKPRLEGRKTLSFNLSHSQRVVVYGFVRDREVGVDIEHVAGRPGLERVARRVFSKDLKERHGANELQAFYQRWTALEALAKFRGVGLGEVLRPAGVPGLERQVRESQRIFSLSVDDNVCGSLVTTAGRRLGFLAGTCDDDNQGANLAPLDNFSSATA